MDKPKFLIVEDEAILALELKSILKQLNCHVIDIVSTQKQVFNAIEQDTPHIILMDIKLKADQDGIKIVQQIQEIQQIPIIYITAFSDDLTMQRAFETNPIDYIVKPFKYEDIKTSIQLAIHKMNLKGSKKTKTNYHYLGNHFYFDTKEKKLYFHDKFINLGVKESKLLSILIKANYSAVPSSTLEEAIWDGYSSSKNTLRTLVYRLKGKLGDDIIQVTYGYGYSLKRPE